MRKMGLEAIYPKRNLSQPAQRSEKYPYLLKGLVLTRPNQVWTTDITYVRLRKGFVYLMATMDWFSRYVLSWEVSNSLDRFFCIPALEAAFQKATPDIFNSDQGSQFTRERFVARLEAARVRIS
jgi:putative transposase